MSTWIFVLWVMQVITCIICSIDGICMIQIFKYFESNNNPLRVMQGRFELIISGMLVMQVFKTSRGGLILVRPRYASLFEYASIQNSRVSFQIYLLTDSIKSYVIFKYTSCPNDLTLEASSGLNSNNNGNLTEILIPQDQECSLSNVKQKGVWVSEVTTNYSLGKYEINKII